MGNAVRVGDDQRWAGIGLRFAQCLQSLLRIGAHRDARHVYVTVGDGLLGHVFLAAGLTAGGKLGHRAQRCGFRHLPAGIGVDFGIHDQDIDVKAGSQRVIESTGTDVIGPAVSANDPDRASDQVVGHRLQLT